MMCVCVCVSVCESMHVSTCMYVRERERLIERYQEPVNEES